eukprot:jgi/Picre1/34044/NNA_001521.t1
MDKFTFQVSTKKNPYQKQKEREEKRRKRDEEETEKVLQDFEKDFGGVTHASSGKDGGQVRKVRRKQSVFGSDQEDESEEDCRQAEQKVHINPEEPLKAHHMVSKGGKVRKMDILLENLKREQAEREMKKDCGDVGIKESRKEVESEESTNLVLKHLAPDIDESTLMHEFGRFGPIASVKIMWPRDEEQRRRGWNTGFVAFMARQDAVKALKEMDGIMFHNHRLGLAWGENVPIPAVPLWPPSSAAVNPESTRKRSIDGPPIKEKINGKGPEVIIEVPKDERTRFIIDALALYVVKDGFDFEQAILQNEKDNELFNFVWDKKCSDHLYYRWRLWSLSNGDSLSSWKVDPFLMFKNSSLWVPPATSLIKSLKTSNSTLVSKTEHGLQPLGTFGSERLNELLSSLTSERKLVADAMLFIISNSESSVEISRILMEFFLSKESNVQKKLDVLYLISDVLYNASAPVQNASQYRPILQDVLPDMFESLQECYLNAPSRMTQEHIRKRVLRVLRAWNGWYIFQEEYLQGLQATFLRGRIDPSGAVKVMDDLPSDSAVLEYKRKLEKMNIAEIENECKKRGVSRRGTHSDMTTRLLTVQTYINH